MQFENLSESALRTLAHKHTHKSRTFENLLQERKVAGIKTSGALANNRDLKQMEITRPVQSTPSSIDLPRSPATLKKSLTSSRTDMQIRG